MWQTIIKAVSAPRAIAGFHDLGTSPVKYRGPYTQIMDEAADHN
jgi:hypothetical protein